MVIGSAVPLLLFLVLSRPNGDGANSPIENQLIWLLIFFAQGHVGMTYLMYLDRTFHSVVRERKLRFVIMPIAIFLLVPALMMSSQILFMTGSIIVIGWNIWHFNKQNLGVCSLISIAEGVPTLTSFDKYLVNAACLIAIAAHYPVALSGYFGETWIQPLLASIGSFAIYPFLAVVTLGVFHMIANHRRYTALKASFYFLALTMFGMVFIGRLYYPGNPTIVSMAYAAAHGVQYILIMYLITISAGLAGQLVIERQLGERLPQAKVNLKGAVAAIMASIALLAWGTYAVASNFWVSSQGATFGMPVTKLIASLVIAGLFVHYVIDAGAFRLSRKEAREWMRGRIGFLMKR
jgi:hypothetical protein